MTYDDYLNEIIPDNSGGKDKRRHVWSIPAIERGRIVWNDCLRRHGMMKENPFDRMVEMGGHFGP